MATPSTSESLEQEDYSTVESTDVESGSDCSSSTFHCQQPAAVVSLLDHLRQVSLSFVFFVVHLFTMRIFSRIIASFSRIIATYGKNLGIE